MDKASLDNSSYYMRGFVYSDVELSWVLSWSCASSWSRQRGV